MIRWAFSFLLVCSVIAFVCSAIRKEDPKEILRSGFVLCAYLTVGTLIFCGALFVALEVL